MKNGVCESRARHTKRKHFTQRHFAQRQELSVRDAFLPARRGRKWPLQRRAIRRSILPPPLPSLSFSFFLARKISWIVTRWNCVSSMNHRFHRADIERERAYVYVCVCMSEKCWNVLEIYSGKIKCPELCVFLDREEE